MRPPILAPNVGSQEQPDQKIKASDHFLLIRLAGESGVARRRGQARGLISGSDWVDWQANGFVNLAEVYQLRGRTADAIEALGQASPRFAAKGNVVSLRRADELADKLRGTLKGTAPDARRSSPCSKARLTNVGGE